MRVVIDGQSLHSSRAGIGSYTYNLVKTYLQFDDVCGVTIIASKACDTAEKLFSQLTTVPAGRSLDKYLPFDALGLSQKFDVYHEPNYIPRPFKKVTVINIFDMSYVLYPQYHPRRRVEMLRFFEHRMRAADRIITASHSAKGEIVDLLKVPASKVAVTPLGVSSGFGRNREDEILFQTLRSRYGLPEYFLLYVGTIEPRKNLERLVEAYGMAKQRLGSSSLGLVLAGGKGWLDGPIYQRVQDLGLMHDVTFTGYVPDQDLPTLYNMAMAFVYPSLYEGFGLPPLEAMACGVPVITSNVSSLPEVVGEAGIMVDPYDVEELSNAIVRVVSSHELRQTLSDKGVRRAAQFTWEECALKTWSVYQECYESRK
ncbi:glycosyltransferase family 4 protein [Acididesulfobacillus acetoxydans]|uniref:glycosyltransferase family 4 protein n=1 Tax=Acididesulfobacillus acetoxydans TaxID=1561005 RepID=UPI0021BF153E|nr:glycosyltransferase family 1 protein [Acididesulfobacillus acetoxydans]